MHYLSHDHTYTQTHKPGPQRNKKNNTCGRKCDIIVQPRCGCNTRIQFCFDNTISRHLSKRKRIHTNWHITHTRTQALKFECRNVIRSKFIRSRIRAYVLSFTIYYLRFSLQFMRKEKSSIKKKIVRTIDKKINLTRDSQPWLCVLV